MAVSSGFSSEPPQGSWLLLGSGQQLLAQLLSPGHRQRPAEAGVEDSRKQEQVAGGKEAQVPQRKERWGGVGGGEKMGTAQ